MLIRKGKYVLLGYFYRKMTYAPTSYVFIVGDLLSLEQHSFNEIILLRERLKKQYMELLEVERLFSVF